MRHDASDPSSTIASKHGTDRSAVPGRRFASRRAWATLALATLLLASCSQHVPETDHAPPAPSSLTTSERPLFGAYTYGGVWSGLEPVEEIEQALGRDLAIVHWFMSFDNAYEPALVDAVIAGGRAPMISWEPVNHDVAAIAAGDHDAYLRSWARGIRDTPGTVYLRPFPEMNGDWTPWNGDPDTLKTAWRRIATLFAHEHAHNVRWVFSPNVTDEPRTPENAMERYYPGDDVVDILALDGYNWGTKRDWSTWTPFQDVFRQGYDRITTLGPQPIWFAEIASAETGGDKSAWVREMFATAGSAFPRLEALIWFDEHKEADWRIASRPEVLAAFREALTVLPTVESDEEGEAEPVATLTAAITSLRN